MYKLAKIIKHKRQDLGLSQSQLALEAHVSLPTIQNIEAGKANLSHSTLEHVLGALGLEMQIVSLSFDWEDVLILGVPLSTSSEKEQKDVLTGSLEFLSRLDQFLKLLPVSKEDMIKASRNWEAFTAFLWALQTHYPKTFSRLRYQKKARHILDQNLKIFELGRLIKLRRIALASIGGLL